MDRKFYKNRIIMQKIKKFSFLFLAFVVVMGCNTKTRKIIAHQEGESFIHLFDGSPNKGRQAW
jgi:Cu(I)/Ag(I) efflux system membrane fusion protein